MKVKVLVWRQRDRQAPGRMVEYEAAGLSPDMSFLEMLDVLNESLIKRGEDPIAFDSDCREGICGSCGVVINGVPHGPLPGVTTCQLYMRHFRDGDTVVVEPWRAKAFPVVKDLVVDRSAFDRIIAAGGFISVNTGSAPEANSLPVGQDLADRSGVLPQGEPEGERRVVQMVEQMEREGFGACSNEGECTAVCPKNISVSHISFLNRRYLRAMLKGS
jgi:succinate dehydrogenase / fumarate reductase iron-sulfur subunit